MPSDPLDITPADPSIVVPFYTTQEVARLLRVSQRTVQDWVRSGELTAVRYGRLLRIRQADVASFGEVLTRRPQPLAADASPSPTPAEASTP